MANSSKFGPGMMILAIWTWFVMPILTFLVLVLVVFG